MKKKRKKKNSSVSICIVWGCWRRASVDRRHWGPSANIIHCHVGCLYLYFSFLFVPSILMAIPFINSTANGLFFFLCLPSRKSSLFFNLVVKVCTRSYPNCSASVCSCGASGLYQQYYFIPYITQKAMTRLCLVCSQLDLPSLFHFINTHTQLGSSSSSSSVL